MKINGHDETTGEEIDHDYDTMIDDIRGVPNETD